MRMILLLIPLMLNTASNSMLKRSGDIQIFSNKLEEGKDVSPGNTSSLLETRHEDILNRQANNARSVSFQYKENFNLDDQKEALFLLEHLRTAYKLNSLNDPQIESILKTAIAQERIKNKNENDTKEILFLKLALQFYQLLGVE